MAQFQGTIQEFHHYIGPRIRNIINTFAKKERMARDGVCETCGKTNQILESAHIHGRGRRTIIEKVLSRYPDNVFIQCDLKTVENEILEEHGTISDVFKFLCKQCHWKYDNLFPTKRNSSAQRASPNVTAATSMDKLKINFFPDNEKTFKSLLIKNQKAYILLHKINGESELKEWRSKSFKETSNLRGNIFSGYLRGWKQKGIVEANLAINESDLSGSNKF